jgi:hypothetical protein
MPLLEPPLEFVNAVKYRIRLQAQNDLARWQTRLTLDLQEISNAGTDRRCGIDWPRDATFVREKGARSREKKERDRSTIRRCFPIRSKRKALRFARTAATLRHSRTGRLGLKRCWRRNLT